MAGFEKTPGKVISIIKRLVDSLSPPTRHRLLRFINRRVLNRPRPTALAALLRPKKKTAHSFTVLASVCNSAPYLDDFFISLARQSIQPDRLQIIAVDNASTDGSARILEAWRKRLSGRLSVLRQEKRNEGAARALGLTAARNEWVTFVNADDYLAPNYFEEADSVLRQYPAGTAGLVFCRQMTVYDLSGSVRDDRPFRSFFQKAESRPLNELGDYTRFLAPGAFFYLPEMRRLNLMGEIQGPSFEDAAFVLPYLRQSLRELALFCPKARYYCRKKAEDDFQAALFEADTRAWLELVQDGYLKKLSQSAEENSGVADSVLQSAVLSDLCWNIKVFLNKPRPPFLSPKEAGRILKAMRQCFSFISRQVIEGHPFASPSLYNVGLLACFKNADPGFHTVSVKEYDPGRRLLLLQYFCREPGTMRIFADNGPALELFDVKNTPQMMLDEIFCYLVSVMVKMPEGAKYLSVDTGGVPGRILLDDATRHGKIEVSLIEKTFASPYVRTAKEYEGAWLLMDRDTNADDNAEHLYRHIKKQHPGQKIFFVLRSSSPDWPRLQKEGFALLNYGGAGFSAALKASGPVVSSHIDEYLTDYLPKMTRYKRFVFLQHGISSDNVSRWLNSKKIDLLIAGAEREYEAIVAENSPYTFSRHKVKLTGFARHDALVPHIGAHEKLVAVMPTWRMSLVSSAQAKSNARLPLKGFLDSEYARAWGSFLTSGRLKALSDTYGFRVMFYPHLNMQMYINDLNLPEYIQLPASAVGSMQDVFKKAAVVVTDYSSVAFEMAFLKKSALYYQFDRDELLSSGNHVYTQGYFDYCRDGFGPVAQTGDTLLDELEKIMARGGEPEPVYLGRMEQTFPWRDGNNCERIYQEILKLARGD